VAELVYSKLVVCPNCGEETPNYEDCILCGHDLRDPDAPPREFDDDEIQQMMMDAKIQEIKIKREMLFGDNWDHAPWLERLQQLAKIAPDNPKVHYYIGAAYIEMAEVRRAIVSLTRAMIADPTFADAIRRRGDCQYTLVPVLSGDVQAYYDRALADYEAALELEPDAYTCNAYGTLIASLGQIERAIEEYGRAAALDPDYAETYFNRGYAYKLLGEAEQAIADFQKFLSFESHWNEEMVAQAQGHIQELTEIE
jgi:tetratricopeptide (TPR) repeat protein